MKVGIDSYCYHRFFGEVYPQQPPPSHRMTLDDFIDRARQLAVDAVSIESCFVAQKDDPAYLRSIKDKLDDYGFDRVWAWGQSGWSGGWPKRSRVSSDVGNVSSCGANRREGDASRGIVADVSL